MPLPNQTFDPKAFEKFCSCLVIDTKERGQQPLKLLGSQRYLIEEICKGLAEGVHTFIVLKGRQMGISTVSVALDLFWLFTHKGLQGALITDTDENRTLFRSYLTQYMASLPRGLKVPEDEHNRNQLVLKNRSRLAYLVAGTRKNRGLGKGHAVNFLHATECGTWGDEDGLASLHSTLASENPNRLYIFESTACGYNMFYEMWESAKDSVTQRAIFIGWWRNEFYRKERTSIEFKTYWDGELTPDEKIWVREVFELYGVNIQPEQIAWYRWKLAEEIRDENRMFQEFPPTEHYAFQHTGSKFFSGERVNILYKNSLDRPCLYFRYRFGLHFDQTEIVECTERASQLTIYEPPHPAGVYVLGCDPAFGSSENADEFCIQVCRCYADRLVQVAEVATTELTEAQFAWIMAHLGGMYRNCMVALEMQGPGGAVYNELQNLKRYAGMPNCINRDIYNVVACMRDYLWRRQDSMTGNVALQWQTNHKEKLRMMSTLRNYFERDMLDVASTNCAEQFRFIIRDGDHIGGEGRAKDDRVIALAIACVAWNDWIMAEMQASNRTFVLENRPAEEPKLVSPLERTVADFFRVNGINFHGISE